MPKFLKWYLLILVMLLATSSLVFSGTTGKIAGKVTDKSTGEGLPGANVVLLAQIKDGNEIPLDRPLGAASDLDGNYVIINIPPGRYVVQTSFVGYSTIKTRDVVVSIDVTTKLDFPMTEEVIQGSEVVVVAEREIVNKSITSSQANIAAEQIQTLPVQEVAEVLRLQAGVSVDRGGGIHIRGGRSSEVAYFVDGVSVTDVYNGGSAVRVENESVQELQVISGTFNAEFGNVMSGVINLVTKDGSQQYHGNVNLYAGDYVSADKDLYLGIDKIDPLATHNVQASLSGPVPALGSKLTFFATGRYYSTDGWLNGRRMFNIYGDTLGVFGGKDGKEAIGGEIVPMNTQQNFSAQVKLSYKLSPSLNLKLSLLGNNDESANYNGFFRWLPDARRTHHDNGYNANLQVTHAIGARSFYTLNISQFFKNYKNYLFENPLDSRYLHPDSLREQSTYDLANSGTENGFYERATTTQLVKFDYTNQINFVHQLKFGFEAKRHKLFEENINIEALRDATGAEIVPFVPSIPPLSSPNHNRYTFKPVEFSVYAQDKIEFESVVINAGMRFDYFDSKGLVLADPSDPNVYQPQNDRYQAMTLEQRLASWYKKPSAKYQLSPRFGIAYPITEKGAIHFSYGHFLQIPSFELLYQNPGFKVPVGSGNYGIYGNADLKPQRTVMYELGLKQQIGESIGIDITGFYRDVRDWVGTSPPIETVGAGGQVLAGRTYFIYRNLDYANVRGITLTLSQVRSRTLTYSVDYTFQVAEGSNSDPGEEFSRRNSNAEPTQFIVPLNWDQRHTFNGTLTFMQSGWTGSLLCRYHTGLPYSPSTAIAANRGLNANFAFSRNSRNAPYFLVFDLRLSKVLRFAGMDFAFLCNVYNLFDRRNEINVYTDSGRATYSPTEYPLAYQATIHNNTAEEFLRQPDRFSEPREVQLGVKVSF
ncbi:MAG: TonB-dependent receptor [candidate division KSB1 bacterium]|nr:TonB-dependent receptor [candidate division KSB1 bacterium]MDZ7301046.1 TonB-dependent receptor [candidate division KSB1 bacterium]MDZ7312129.1 TonB-dependent receptor [candidate division KSB1 bacterium]